MNAYLDGDILAYRIGFACQTKEEIPSVSEDICKARLQSFIVNVMMDVEADGYDGYFTKDSSTNFRLKIATSYPYKGQRSGSKPYYYDLIRSELENTWGFIGVSGIEADDAIAIAATENGLDQTTICSIDKDFLQIPCYHYNYVSRKIHNESEYSGFYNFCTQVLTGDRIDNVVGLRGVGPKRAAKLLDDATTREGLLSVCKRSYEQASDGGYSRFVENCQLLWLKRYPIDSGKTELIDELLEKIAN